MFKEFKQFALKGNVFDMAVGIIIGGAFTPIARSLVDDVLMPPIGLLLGNVDFTDLFVVLRAGSEPGPYATLAEARELGAVTLNYGAFVNTLVTFVIVAFAVYLLVRGINRLREREPQAPPAPAEKKCPHCISVIPIDATRCPRCTSQLEAPAA